MVYVNMNSYKSRKMNNKGMTLIETVVSFAILGILLVVAAEIIHSTTEVYYLTKTTSYGIQAAQIVATELRGDLEDALPLALNGTSGTADIRIDKSNKTGDKSLHGIEFIDMKGRTVKYSFETNAGVTVLKKEVTPTYDENNMSYLTTPGATVVDRIYNSKYIGMGYEVIDISFSKLNKQYTRDGNALKTTEDLPISDCPVLVMEITVGNKQYDNYTCTEYIPLYNFYGISDTDSRIVETN